MYKMKTLDLSSHQRALENGEVVATIRNLKMLYRMADDSLSSLARELYRFENASDLQTQLLEKKERLVKFVTNIECSNIHEISQKIDFLNLVHLNELGSDDFTAADSLTNSLHKDCAAFL